MMSFCARSFTLAALVLALTGVMLTSEPLAAQAPTPFFYYYSGTRIPLTLDRTRIAVTFIPGTDRSARRAAIDAAGDLGSLDASVQEPLLELSLVPVRASTDPLTAIARLRTNTAVQSAGPVFAFPGGSIYAETDEFLARFKPGTTAEEIAAFNAANGVELVRPREYSRDVLILRPGRGNKLGARELANRFVESGRVDFAEPNFVIVQPRGQDLRPATSALAPSMTPNDPGFGLQWWLQNTQQFKGSQAGADIDATHAWGVTTGAITITVAVIDEGIDGTHPDLQGKLVTGINVTKTPNDTDTSPGPFDDHATAIAGIIGAATNNGIGVAGVCPLCKIMPVKVATSRADGSWVTQVSMLIAGIDWAWQHGADVLSNSWTMSAPSDAMDFELANARAGGRGNYGSTVLFAAGNEGLNVVDYPASRNKLVIAVGASNWCDGVKRNSSTDPCEDGSAWGSNTGPSLDVLAPGMQVYTTWKGGGYGYFLGTSAATPIAAGVAGLIYSLNPYLTPTDLELVLEGGGTRVYDVTLGRSFKRVNAYGALAALYDLSLTGTNDKALVLGGDMISYALTYGNPGRTDVAAPYLQVTLPPDLTLTGSNPPLTSLGSGVYRLDLPALTTYAQGTATFDAQVISNPASSSLDVIALIGSDRPELITSNNSVTLHTGVARFDFFLPLIWK